MKRKTKIIIFIVVIIAVILPIYMLNAVSKKIEERDKNKKNLTNDNNIVNQNITMNK